MCIFRRGCAPAPCLCCPFELVHQGCPVHSGGPHHLEGCTLPVIQGSCIGPSSQQGVGGFMPPSRRGSMQGCAPKQVSRLQPRPRLRQRCNERGVIALGGDVQGSAGRSVHEGDGCPCGCQGTQVIPAATVGSDMHGRAKGSGTVCRGAAPSVYHSPCLQCLLQNINTMALSDDVKGCHARLRGGRVVGVSGFHSELHVTLPLAE